MAKPFYNAERKLKEKLGDEAYYNLLQAHADNNLGLLPPNFRPVGFVLDQRKAKKKR
jgi:hypothetical protein